MARDKNDSPKISVIVRTKNEQNTLKAALQSILIQSEKPCEIILADNLSTDSTRTIAKKLSCKIIEIPEPFNHARSCNMAISKSQGNIIVLISGHSIFTSNDAFKLGLSHLKNPLVAGVYGCLFANKNASFWERLDKKFTFVNPTTIKTFTKPELRSAGLMTTACCILKKSLWEKYHFDETLSRQAHGGEDTDWGYHFMKEGYEIIQDPKFSAYHSHGDNFTKFVKRQYAYFKMLNAVNSKYINQFK